MKTVVVITGHTFTGKTRLAQNLQQRLGYTVFDSSKRIRRYASTRKREKDRRSLQELGDILDKETGGSWVFDGVERLLRRNTTSSVVIDNIRSWDQLLKFRSTRKWKVTHIHLFASPKRREEEFNSHVKERGKEPRIGNYKQADLVKNERDIRRFKEDADIRINTDNTDSDDVFVRVSAQLGYTPTPETQLVDVLIGGQFGSEGKGHIAAYLAREYDVLIRVGGPNAGHTVSSESGVYTYHQLPSGCRDSQAEVLIGPGATIYPKSFLKEIRECNISPERLFVDPQAVVIEDADIDREQALKERIGSTASGSGSASARKIMCRGSDQIRLAKDCKDLEPYVGNQKPYRGNTVDRLEVAYRSGKSVLLEGTQGSGLSIHHGQYPHVTSRDTNVAGCIAEAGISPRRVRRIIMVVRPTPIRVADPDKSDKSSGDLKKEITFDTVAEDSGLNARTIKRTEKTSTTNRDRRVGRFDWSLFARSCSLNCPTDIVLTFADYLDSKNAKARRFDRLAPETIQFIEELERVARAPVSLINTRFPRDPSERVDLRTVIDRRDWMTTKVLSEWADI